MKKHIVQKIFVLFFVLIILIIIPKETLAAGEFITTWKTDNIGTSASNQITIPTTGGGYNYNIDWGDGNTDTGVTGNITHTYAIIGTYTVSITGTFPQIYFNNTGDKQKILTIEQWGNIQWVSMQSAFKGASKLTINAADSPDLSIATSLNSMFYGASLFNQDINSWNVSHITDMGYLFYNATIFNKPLNNWDVSHVTSMYWTFFFAKAFNQDISSWNVSSVTDMSGMMRAESFNQPLNSWNVSNVTTMYYMFAGAKVFNQPLNNWIVTKVTDMTNMFSGCTSFNQNISSWNISNVTSLYSMFTSATIYNQPLNSWNVSNVTTMGLMFFNATAFNQDISSWNVSKVNSMKWMFSGATAFNQDISLWNVSLVTDMSQMFLGCNNFNQNIGSWNVGNVLDMSSMFNGARAFNQNISSWNVSKVTTMYNMFSYADSFNQSLNSWNVSNVTNMNSMFYSAKSFNQPLNSWDVSKVTGMNATFYGATLFNQPLNLWNVSKVTNMAVMFRNATSFNQNISSWVITSVTTMASMFNGAKLSMANYDSILSSWSSLILKTNVPFDAGSSKYCSSIAQKASIISTYNWTIIDGGVCRAISIIPIGGITPPAMGATPITTVTETAEYTATVSWSDNPITFNPGTSYTATVILTPKEGYLLTGIPANFFTVTGSTSVTNLIDSGIVTILFPTTILIVPPTLTSEVVSLITQTSATLNGTITNTGGENSSTRGFEYGLNNNYGLTSSTTGSYGVGSFTSDITGLVCSTIYHFKSFATNTSGTGSGNDNTFTTSACPIVSNSSGSSANTRIRNLIAMNKIEEARKIAEEFPIYIDTEIKNELLTQPTLITQILPIKFNTLKYGSTGDDVKNLQIYLNTHGYPVAKSGVGSSGKETDYFGALTKKAVIAFQKTNKLIADGVVGPKTIGVMK